MKPLRLFAISTLCTFTVQAAAAAETLSWDASVQETAANNPQLRAAQENVTAKDFAVTGARAGYFPTLTGNLSYTKSSGEIDTSNAAGSFSNDKYAATLSLSQNLFNGLQDQAKVKQAQANFHSSESSLTQTKSQVTADLKNAFSSVQYAQNLVKLQETIIARREENMRLVELRFRSGRENRGSLLLAQSYTKQAKLDHLNAKNNINSAGADLARVLGREEIPISITGTIPLSPLPKQPDFRKLASVAPEIKQSQFSVTASEASVTMARGGFFPTLALNASTGRQDRDWFPEQERWSVGATLSFPIFNGGKDYAAARGASADLRSARETLDNVTKTQITTLQSAYNAYEEANEKLEVDKSFREAATLRAEIARAKYNNGLMTFEDWDLVESDLIAREKAVLQSQKEQIRTEAAWVRAQGLGVLP